MTLAITRSINLDRNDSSRRRRGGRSAPGAGPSVSASFPEVVLSGLRPGGAPRRAPSAIYCVRAMMPLNTLETRSTIGCNHSFVYNMSHIAVVPLGSGSAYANIPSANPRSLPLDNGARSKSGLNASVERFGDRRGNAKYLRIGARAPQVQSMPTVLGSAPAAIPRAPPSLLPPLPKPARTRRRPC